MDDSPAGRGLFRGRKKTQTPRGRGRRSQADREAIARAEEERIRPRAEQYAKEQADAQLEAEKQRKAAQTRGRGRGRGRGGRGGFMGDQLAGPLSAGSVFSSQNQSEKHHPRPWVSNKKAASFASKKGESSQTRIAKDRDKGPAFSVENADQTMRDEDYDSSDADDRFEGRRVDIDQLQFGGGDDANDDFNAPGLEPIRILRVPHQDRTKALNHVRSAATTVGLDPEANDGHGCHLPKDGPAANETGEEDEIMLEPNNDSQTVHAAANGKGAKFARREDDVEDNQAKLFQAILLAELGNINLGSHEQAGQADSNVPTQSFDDEKEGRVFMFQFPPKLPGFIDPVKQEAASVRPQDAQIVDLSSDPNTELAEGGGIKIEEDVEYMGTHPFGPIPPNNILQPVSGAAGKLRVHKSGKVTMQWGNCSFVVHPGAQTSCLTEMLMVKPDVNKPMTGNPTGYSGQAVVLDQIRGRFVVTPDWDKILDDETA